MSSPKIPPGLRQQLYKLSEEGQESEDLAQWLWREHKIEITARSVRRLLRHRRDELADVAKSVVRDELRKHLLPAIRRMTGVALRAARVERKARKTATTLSPNTVKVIKKSDDGKTRVQEVRADSLRYSLLALRAMDRQLAASNMLLHYAGLNQPDKPGTVTVKVSEARQALMKRIEELAAAPLPPTEPPVH